MKMTKEMFELTQDAKLKQQKELLSDGEQEIFAELHYIITNPPSPQQLFVSLSGIVHKMLSIVYLADSSEDKKVYHEYKSMVKKTSSLRTVFEPTTNHNENIFHVKDDLHNITVPFQQSKLAVGVNIARHYQYEAMISDLWEIEADIHGYLMSKGLLSMFGKRNMDYYLSLSQSSKEREDETTFNQNMFHDNLGGSDE